MIRVIIFLALVALLALGAAWLAERPGEIAIIWQGRIIETSLMVAMVALTIVVALAVLLWSMVRTVLRSPDLIALFINRRRGVRGYLAISRGLIAVGAGDLRAARKFAAEAERLQPGEPLALLLSAQTAQLSDDRAAAESAFCAMAERDDTKLLGLRGLFVEARRREDMAAARNYAEEAAKTAPALAWAGQAALELRCASGDWAGALAALERNVKNRLIDKPTYKRQRAVLLTACALAADETDHERARALALEAVKLAPSLVPAAELAGRLLAEANKLRKASRIIETAWQANPHPDLAAAYAHLRFGDSARDRLARVQALAQKTHGHIESAIAVARAAIDAHEFAVARAVLKLLLAEPTQRVAELMAELEHVESGDEGRSREWMARAVRAARDPAWTADGFVSDRWLPVSPVSGRLDALQWQAPITALGGEGTVIEGNDQPPPIDAPVPKAVPPTEVLERADQPQTRAAATAKAMIRHSVAPARAAPQVAAVIPLVHAPDDPGPELSAEPEPARPEPPADTWWRLRLFK